MGKSKNNKIQMSKEQGEKGRKSASKTKLKRDDKTKKPGEEDHLKHIPFRLREIMKSKERMKAKSRTSKKIKNATASNSEPKKFQDGDIPVPHFKRRKRESVKAYLGRMENETKHVLFLTNNQVDRRPELDIDQQEKPADKGKSDKKKEYARMRRNKLQQKKFEKLESKVEKEMFVENVPFGEVAVAPPMLNIKPRKAQNKSQAPKELLLNSLLGHTVASTAKPSMARQRLMEEERLRAVEAYRQLKKQKQQQLEARAGGVGKLVS
uniref:Coiled-coil domain containing 137 n=1 Tax=Oryzias latipes TaxID=8090 RepID=A0A3P9J7P2_ORYLA